MAIGLTPGFEMEESFESLNSEQLYALVYETANALGWKTGSLNGSLLVAFTPYSLIYGQQEIHIEVEGSRVHFQSMNIHQAWFDYGRNKRHSSIFFSKLNYLKEKLSNEELTQKYEDLGPTILRGNTTDAPLYTSSRENHTNSLLSFFIPTPGYFITPILINLNILIFILMAISGSGILVPDNQVMLAWGANFKPLTVDGGQWWRLFTCTFIHAGILHLLMNMYALGYIGLLLEPLLGKGRFAILYVLTGLAASTTSLGWHELIVCVGASGAIFGLYGIFLAMLTTNLIEKTARNAFLTSIGIFVAYNLLNGMKGNIDNAAHIGGLLSGMVLGYITYFSLRRPANIRLNYWITAGSIISTLWVIWLVFHQFPQKYNEYDQQMAVFGKYEEQALGIYHHLSDNKDSAILQVEQGIGNWQKSLQLFDKMDQMGMPAEINVRTDKIREYVKLRLETYELIKTGILKDNMDSILIASKNQKIDSLLKSMK